MENLSLIKYFLLTVAILISINVNGMDLVEPTYHLEKSDAMSLGINISSYNSACGENMDALLVTHIFENTKVLDSKLLVKNHNKMTLAMVPLGFVSLEKNREYQSKICLAQEFINHSQIYFHISDEKSKDIQYLIRLIDGPKSQHEDSRRLDNIVCSKPSVNCK